MADEQILQALTERGDRLGSGLDGLERRSDRHLDSLSERLDARMDELEQQIGGGLTKLRVDMMERMGRFEKRQSR